MIYPLPGTLSPEETTASFGRKYIFPYASGFILAVATERWNLHERLALNIISAIGSDADRIVPGVMAAPAFLSTWISNTASSVTMLPIGLAII